MLLLLLGPFYLTCGYSLLTEEGGLHGIACLHASQSPLSSHVTSVLCTRLPTGLYLTFVYGLGRFLRLSVSNLRLTIPYEELPSTRRLVTLCQVRRVSGCRVVTRHGTQARRSIMGTI